MEQEDNSREGGYAEEEVLPGQDLRVDDQEGVPSDSHIKELDLLPEGDAE